MSELAPKPSQRNEPWSLYSKASRGLFYDEEVLPDADSTLLQGRNEEESKYFEDELLLASLADMMLSVPSLSASSHKQIVHRDINLRSCLHSRFIVWLPLSQLGMYRVLGSAQFDLLRWPVWTVTAGLE